MRLPHLVAATLLCVAATARGDEVPTLPAPAPVAPAPPPEAARPPAVEDVARLLVSQVAAERERGEALLVLALRTVPDRAGFLERLAGVLRGKAQVPAEGVPAHDAPPPAPVPPPATAAAPQDGFVPADERGAPQVEGVPQGGGGAGGGKAGPPLQSPKAPKAPKAPTWTLRAWGVSVPWKEAAGLKPAGGIQTESENGGFTEASGGAENASAWSEVALRAADAVPLGEATLSLPDDEPQSAHLGANLVYRCCAVESKGGAWRVETGKIDVGLSVRATMTKAGLTVEPVWVTVAQPVSTEATRPAPGVDLELDRPDWSAARTRHVLPLGKDRGAGFLVIPGLLPEADRRLVLVLELRPRP